MNHGRLPGVLARRPGRLLSPISAVIAIIAFAQGRLGAGVVMLVLAVFPWLPMPADPEAPTQRRAVIYAAVVGVAGIVMGVLGVAGQFGGSPYPGFLAIAAGLFFLWGAARRASGRPPLVEGSRARPPRP